MDNKTDRLRLVALLASLGFAGAALQGCNTVEGLGQDLEESSNNVQDAFSDDEPDEIEYVAPDSGYTAPEPEPIDDMR